jgi:hypothetical protein
VYRTAGGEAVITKGASNAPHHHSSTEDKAMIDYARMQKSGPKLKAALTRAKKKGYAAVLVACQEAIHEWEQVGAWPDNWAIWQSALNDAAFAERKFAPRMETL